MSMVFIAFDLLEVQLRRRACARLLRSRLQVNAAFCGAQAYSRGLARPMTFSVARHGDTTRIDVGAQLGVANRQELKDLVLDRLRGGERKFLIDFAGTDYIDSSGLGVLVSLSKKVGEQRGDLRLLNLSDELRALFRLTKLDALFKLGGDTPSGEATAGSLAPLKPRPPGPLHGAAEAHLPRPDEGAPS